MLLIISNGAYILFSFIAFIAYAFIYLFFVGMLNGGKANLQNRPEVTGYESLRKGDRNIGEEDRITIVRLTNPGDEDGESGSTYDYEATFYGNESNYELFEDPEVPSGPKDNKANSPEASPLTASEEEESDEDDEWPTLKSAIECRMDDSTAELTLSNDIVGDLTAEELVHLTTIRVTTLNDAELYPELVEECKAANKRVNELVHETGKRVEEIVSTLLTTREKVIFNAFPMVKHSQAA
ncbi:hypothetical protein [Salmonirosea aquatica]|uniref:Uncharacterized protein n=1 Tax=Salmonirosea aquatica TaxID=2654236 RepID=A0A7C9BW98_9BACT|nr:hypothetical protein [Cytophagaceae bacterium SJW1-29]